MLKRKVLLTLIVISSSLLLRAQSKIDTTGFIPPLDSLKKSLRTFYQIKSESEQTEFRYVTKFKFLKFLPSFGLVANRPLVSINTSTLYTQVNEARERKAKLSGINKINEVQFNEDLTTVKYLLATLTKKVTFYNDQLTILLLEDQKFEIVQKSYENKELVPSEYLDKKISYQNFKSSVRQLEVELYDLKNKILIIAKQAPWESLYVNP